jgi:hypothetical protein
MQLVSDQAIATLSAAGIRTASLKGTTMSEALFRDAGRRVSSDIDLLVPPDQLEDAVIVIEDFGYDRPTDVRECGGLPLLHFGLRHREDKLPPIELHWRIHWYDRHFASERLLPPDLQSVNGWHPTPADALTALLLFYARDGFLDMRLATDLSAWWDAYGEALPPDGLAATLQSYPAFARVIPAAAEVSEAIVGLPAATVLGKIPNSGLRGHIATRLADPNPTLSGPQIYANVGLIDGLLAPPGGLRQSLRRHVLVPSDIMIARGRRLSGLQGKSSWGHSWRVLARYLLAMPKAIRGPETPDSNSR